MELQLTKDQLKDLLDVVYAGNLMLNGLRHKDERIQKYSEVEQIIFKLAVENEITDVEFSEEFNEYMPTSEFESGEIEKFIDEYEDCLFYDELVVRLARRDALNVLGDINPEMSPAELRELQFKFEDQYDEEIEYHGIARLKVTPLE